MKTLKKYVPHMLAILGFILIILGLVL